MAFKRTVFIRSQRGCSWSPLRKYFDLHRTTELNSTVDLRLKVNTDEVSTTITEESEQSKGNYNREPPEDCAESTKQQKAIYAIP